MAGIKNEEELFQTYCKIANGISDIERLCVAAYKTGVMDGIQAVVKNAEAHPDD